MSNHHYVVIVGCGQTGSRLANRLSAQGQSVVVIDRRPESFAALSLEFSGFSLEGDGTDAACLEQAKIGQADLVVAATREDAVNMMVAQLAQRVYKVPRVVVRVFHPERASFCRELGLTTICPADATADAVLGLVGFGGGSGGCREGS